MRLWFDECKLPIGESPCRACKQEECECCKDCGASPSQACQEWCGLTNYDEDDLDDNIELVGLGHFVYREDCE